MLCRLFPLRRLEKEECVPQDLSPVLIAAALSYLFLTLFQSIFYLFVQLFLPSLASVLSLFGTSLASVPIFLYLHLSKRSLSAALFIRKEKPSVRALLFLPFGMLLAFFLAALLLCLGAYECVGVSLGALLYFPLLLLAYAVQGSAEELLCRGLLMSALSERFGGIVGALVSALFFSAMHIWNPAVSLLGLLNIFLFGLLLASVTQRERSILSACLMHAGWNLAVHLLGVQVSGVQGDFSLLSLEVKDLLWSGGAFGPEGSPILCVLLTVLLLFPLLPSRKK